MYVNIEKTNARGVFMLAFFRRIFSIVLSFIVGFVTYPVSYIPSKLDVDFAIKISLPGVIAAQSIEEGSANLEIPKI